VNIPVPKNLIREIAGSLSELDRHVAASGEAEPLGKIQLLVDKDPEAATLDTTDIVDSYTRLLRTFRQCDPQPHVPLQKLGASPTIFEWPRARHLSPIDAGVTTVLAKLGQVTDMCEKPVRSKLVQQCEEALEQTIEETIAAQNRRAVLEMMNAPNGLSELQSGDYASFINSVVDPLIKFGKQEDSGACEFYMPKAVLDGGFSRSKPIPVLVVSTSLTHARKKVEEILQHSIPHRSFVHPEFVAPSDVPNTLQAIGTILWFKYPKPIPIMRHLVLRV
jgi:hypothetical protein